MENKLDNINSFYFVGIGGVSMSSLAMILKVRGKKVAGYDFKQSAVTEKLKKDGINVFYTKDNSNSQGFDACVYTAAIKEDDIEFINACKNCRYVFTRAELLGMITENFAHSIGVAGTHGKSTTTGMISEIILDYDEESTVLGGAFIPSISSFYKCGNGPSAVFEACEYKNSYHAMKPTVKVVLNCEHDHVDFFPTIGDVIDSFHTFIDTPRGNEDENIAIVNMDCKNSVEAAKNTRAKVYYYSICGKSDFYASDIKMNNGCGEFDIIHDDRVLVHVKLAVPGIHNISNACAACAAAYCVGASPENIKKGLESFGGVSRRFERKGVLNGAVLADDYAHHPDEIKATLGAAKLMGFKRIVVIFQPHTYSRTKALLKEFADVLKIADIAVLAEIYSARETNTGGVSSADIADLTEHGKYMESFEEICDFIKKEASDGDLIITMGAGNINTVWDMILKDN